MNERVGRRRRVALPVLGRRIVAMQMGSVMNSMVVRDQVIKIFGLNRRVLEMGVIDLPRGSWVEKVERKMRQILVIGDRMCSTSSHIVVFL